MSVPRACTEALDRVTLRTTFESDGLSSRHEILEALEHEASFRVVFRESLAASPFPAFFWETPAWHADDLARPYEHIVKDAPSLAGVGSEEGPFREHLHGHRGVATFLNLGGDAELVAPCLDGEPEAYPHLAAFVRLAPAQQVDELLALTARVLRQRLAAGSSPTWLSTSGLGVYWVHVRLDLVPKYYTHAPYRTP